ncbi:hypothetical protein [Streptomyces sp. SBT349]|uniref:hypothetical protein n=1 Tax=Streptomyces sp. SBT349 TaxID=1580539 RepID=UPI00066A563C|nr:hypothetical protein [Streptomyces sp. SBT349]
MARPVPRTDVLMVLMGAPHESDLTTSVLRLVQAMLERGGSVQVWACGYATTLTQASLGAHKPRDIAHWSRAYPSTAALVGELLAAFPGRLHWYVCRFCSEDRGAGEQMPGVALRGPSAFAANGAAAAKTMMVGVL